MSRKAESVRQLVGEINKALNSGRPKGSDVKRFVSVADDVDTPFLLRRPTGIPSLDIALRGGLPAGGVTQIAGPDGVGKNALCHQIIASCQRIYGDEAAIAWAWTEYPLDKSFAQIFGVRVPMSSMEIEMENDARKQGGMRPLTRQEMTRRKEKVGEFMIIGTGSTAKRLEAVVRIVQSNLFQVVVVDSVAALLTEQRSDRDLDEEPQQSSEARLITEFQKKLWGAYGEPAEDTGSVNWTTTIVINQARANRSTAPFKKEWTVGGAYALRHGKLVDLHLQKADVIRDPTTKNKVGRIIKWEITKGKAGCHDGPTGSVEYHYQSGYQVEADLVTAALTSGVIERKGGFYFLLDAEGQEIDRVRSMQDLQDKAMDKDWFNAVYQLILIKEGVSCLYKL